MDDGVADVEVVVGNFNDLSLPEQLMEAERQKDGGQAVQKLLRQVHYCWPPTELPK
jgi:hypothetical protein